MAPFIAYALLALVILTAVLTLFYGPDFTTYRTEIEHIALSASFGPFIVLIKAAQFLKAPHIAREIAAVALSANAAITEHIYSK